MSDQQSAKQTVNVYYEDSAALQYLTASGLVVKGAMRFAEIILTAAEAASTLDLYDGIDDSGTESIPIAAAANSSAHISLHGSVKFNKGCYAKIVGAGAKVAIAYFVDFPD